MVWIGRSIVICLVTTHAGVRRVVVVPVVTSRAIIGNTRMCPVQIVIIVVNRECGRLPTRGGRVAHGAIGRDVQCNVIGVGRPVKIRGVTTRAGIGRIVEIPSNMTKSAVVRNGYMRSSEWVNLVVIISRRGPSRF